MRRISRRGTLWIFGVMLVVAGTVHPSVVASAEPKAARTMREFIESHRPDYFAPTPQRPASKKPFVDPNAAFTAKVKPGSFALVLNDGNRYIWTPTADKKLPLETAFATVEVPLALVAFVSFAGEQGAVKVTFRNGDVLTGKLLLKELAIRTAYGDLTVPIRAMTFLGAGGVTKPATASLPSPNGAVISGTLDAIAPPLRPAPAARFDRVLR